jgi:hypothetical protein
MRQEITLMLIFTVIIITAVILGKSSDIYNPLHSVKETVAAVVIPEKSIVWVYNGCRRSGLAEKVTNILRSKGYDSYNKGNMSAQTYTKTLVISRNGNMKVAKAVADELGVENSFFLFSDIETTNEITVIVGDSFKELE